MPTPATDRKRLALIVVAVVSVGLAVLSFKVLNAAAATAARPIPVADVQSLSAYLVPLPDSTSLAVSGNGTMVGQSDPFGPVRPAVRTSVRGSAPSDTTMRAAVQRWVVSSILFEDSKRSAIVNNAWVSVGDPLEGGARVTAIERKYVVVTDAKGNRQVVSIQGVRRED